jgi:hypothetical protein
MKTEKRTERYKYEGLSLRPTKAQDYYMVGQSQSSAYAHQPNCSTSGIRNLEEAIVRLCEGGYVLDKRELSWEVACNVISGPMDQVDLPPMTMRRAYEKARTFGSFREFYDYLDSPECGGMSFANLSMDLYAAWWHRLGAKVGRKVKGVIQWKAPYSGPLFEGKEVNV